MFDNKQKSKQITMTNLINCGYHRIQKLGRIAIGKDTIESENLKEGDIIEVFIRRKIK